MSERGFFEQNEIDKYYPNALMIQPMGIWQIPNNKKNMTEDILAEKQNEYFAEVKKDGNWYAISITKDEVYLFSRTISKKTNLLVEKGKNIPHITETFKKLPAGTYIEGEIYYPNENSDLVRTIMGCDADKALKRQKGLDKKYNEQINNFEGKERKIYFYIHNILYFDNESYLNKTNLERYNKLAEIYYEYLSENKYIHLAEIYMPNEWNFFKKAEELIDKGEEGLVLKKINGKYYPDFKKAWETIKLKRENSVDVFCIGFEEPTIYYEGDLIESWQYWIKKDTDEMAQGNYYGNNEYLPITKNYFMNWIGAVEFGVYGEQGEIISLGTVSSGLTDSLKEEIKKNPEEFYMKPILLECMEIYHGNSIRSPRLIKFREDINPEDCTLEKIK